MSVDRLADRFPIRLYAAGSQTMVDWCRLGDESFDHPFFRQTVSLCLRRPFNLAFRTQTTIDALLERQAADPGPAPDGFIFHLSRCGSTLLGRMLNALEGSLVISEPNPLDAALRAPLPGVADDEMRVRWLRAVIGAFGRMRRGVKQRYFVKCDAWATLQIELFARAFPGVPWVFLYRDPLEVLVSHAREDVYIMMPAAAPTFFGIAEAEAQRIPPLDYRARVLAKICRAALDAGADAKRLVNYRELPSVAWERIAPLFGIEPNAAEIARMHEVTRSDAKSPDREFRSDAASKHVAAIAEMRGAVDRWARPLYDELEKRRLGVDVKG
jgi:hypothetical protein